MSWIKESRPVVDKEGVKAELQLILFESVVGDRPGSRKEVLRVLTDKKTFPPAVKSVLDFTCAQANGCKELKAKKLSLEDKFKYKAYSPLMVAVEKDKYELAEELLKAGASVAFKNKDRRTALHIASKMGHAHMVQLLLDTAKKQTAFNRQLLENDCKLVVNSKHKPNGWTPLMYAVLEEHMNVIEVLMNCKYLNLREENKKQQNVFHIAAREGKMECLKELCSDKERELEVLIGVAAVDQKRRNILHHVCAQSNVAMLNWLLDKFEQLKNEQFLNQQSISVNKKDKEGDGKKEIPTAMYTPFLVACEYKKLNMVKRLGDEIPMKKLMESTCCKNGRTGITAIHLAAAHDDEELTKYLVEEVAAHTKPITKDKRELAGYQHDILLNTKDGEGNTVLHVAMASGSKRVVRYVRENCKDLESVENKNGETPRETVYFIPPEIRKMGEAAVRAYRKALNEGARPIPYYSMLILGQERVGKTSLYRQLVGKIFIVDLDSTRGIDNNTVETVDIKIISLDPEKQSAWKEVSSDPSNTFTNAITEEAIKHMPELPEEQKTDFQARDEAILIGRIKRLEKELAPPLPRVKSSPVRSSMSKTTSQQNAVDLAIQTKKEKPASPIIQPSTAAGEPKRLVLKGHSRDGFESTKKSSLVSPISPSLAAPIKPSVSPEPIQFQSLPNPIMVDKEVTIEEKIEVEDKVQIKEKVPKEESGLMNRRQGVSVAKSLKRRNKRESECPELTLNTLDFAGQSEYRPMHHCFISRRACYLVVFKAIDMVKYLAKKDECKENPFEEVRYWIHSINAHIYTPAPEENDKEMTISRVILVGTYSKDCSEADLKNVDELLADLWNDKRCVNHLVKLNPTSFYNSFIPVENSCDIVNNEKEYLKESGTYIVQESIKKLSRKLPFLKESYPIKWLSFMERIEDKEGTTPVVTMNELIDMAKESHLTEDQDLAIEYLHKSGKIICLEHLPCLFLHDNEKAQLKDKVIIRPRWMISVMRKIVELDHSSCYEGIQPSFLQDLGLHGIADKHLLEKRWKEDLDRFGVLELHHICFLLQAYCLIVPIKSKGTIKSEDMADQSLPEKYLIPCKLPPERDVSDTSDYFDFTVHFNFHKFLPDVVYHRLLCRLIMLAGQEYSDNIFTKVECIVNDVDGLDWWVKHKASSHTLEIILRGSDRTVKDLKRAHELVQEVCKGSELQGLWYECLCPGKCSWCKQAELVICVKFNEGKVNVIVDDEGTGKCSKCKKMMGKISTGIESRRVSGHSLDRELSIDDLLNVYEVVFTTRSEWYNLGLALKISSNTLSAIEKDGGSVAACFRKVLQEWLQSGSKKTFTVLAEALGGKLVGRADLKEKILG